MEMHYTILAINYLFVGGRFEQIEQYVYYVSLDAPDGTGTTYAPVKFLPSIIAKYKLTDKQKT
jgi:hypothetical protein